MNLTNSTEIWVYVITYRKYYISLVEQGHKKGSILDLIRTSVSTEIWSKVSTQIYRGRMFILNLKSIGGTLM